MGQFSVIMGILRVLKLPFVLLFKVLTFTGIYIPLAVAIGMSYLFEEILHINTSLQNPAAYYTLDTLWYVSWAFPVLITIRNLIRLKNPDFKMTRFLFRMNTASGSSTGAAKAPKRLQGESGVVFGRDGGRYITKPETEEGHTLVIGGAGSGKSSCVAIPTLLNWQGSVFAIDIKGELSNSVKHRRPNMVVLDPEAGGVSYDPLVELRRSSNRAQAAKRIVNAIVPLPASVKDPFWISSAQNLFASAILHFSHTMDFPALCRTVQVTPLNELVQMLAESPDENARMFVNSFIGMDAKTLSGIYTELANKLLTFATDYELQRCLGSSGGTVITPYDLEQGKDIFIRIPESKIEVWRGFLTLIVAQFLAAFEMRPDRNDKPILMLLDEFARLGKIEGIMNALSTLRSKNIHICILTQSLAQLDVLYGKDERKVIADNCAYKLVLRATDAETQDYFSRLVGTHDVVKTSLSSNQAAFTGIQTGKGKTRSEQERRIIKPEELAYLDKPILFTPYGFYRPAKTPYYEDPRFKKLSAAG